MSTSRHAVAALAAAALAAAAPAGAEEREARNAIFAEGLGPGLAYSVNFERLVEQDFALRLGVSYLSISASAGGAAASASWLSIPVTASYLGIGSGNHSLEIGAGATLIRAGGSGTSMGISATGEGMTVWGTALIGWRRQPPEGGFQFRLGLCALVGKGLGFDAQDPSALGVVPWLYMSMGAAF